MAMLVRKNTIVICDNCGYAEKLENAGFSRDLAAILFDEVGWHIHEKTLRCLCPLCAKETGGYIYFDRLASKDSQKLHAIQVIRMFGMKIITTPLNADEICEISEGGYENA